MFTAFITIVRNPLCKKKKSKTVLIVDANIAPVTTMPGISRTNNAEIWTILDKKKRNVYVGV